MKERKTRIKGREILSSRPTSRNAAMMPSTSLLSLLWLFFDLNFVFPLFFRLSRISPRVSQGSYPWTDDGDGWVLGDPPSVIRNGWYGWSNPPIRHADRMV